MKLLLAFFVAISIYIVAQLAWTGFFILKSKSLMIQTSYPKEINFGSGKELNIYFLGDSITAGVGTTSFESTLAYKISQNLSKDSKVHYINFARSGNKMKELIAQDVPKQKADYTIIFIGSNDLFHFTNIREFESSAKIVLDKWAPSAGKVIFMGPANVGGASAIPLFLKPYYQINMPVYGNVLRKLAKNYSNVKYVYPGDYIEMFKKYKHTEAVDGFHPNDNGNSFWAEVLLSNIKK